MNIKFLAILSLSVLLFTCKNGEQTDESSTTDQNSSQNITAQDISNLDYTEFVLDPKAKKITNNWELYNEFQGQVNNIKAGDLTYLNYEKDAINAFFKGFKENIPDPLNNNAIIARITVIETNLHLVENISKLSTTTKEELIQGIKTYLIAATNLDFQINKIVEKESQQIEKS